MRRQALQPRNDLLASPFTRIARALSRNHGVTVVPSSGSLKTDGKSIFVPFISETANGATLEALNGMLDHELGHVLVEEDCRRRGVPGFIERMVAKRKAGDQRTATLMNVVEDCRIERDLGREFPGMKDNLSRKNKHFIAGHRKRFEAGDRLSLWAEMTIGFLARSRENDSTWLSTEVAKKLDACQDLIERSRSLSSVEESVSLAHELSERWKEISDDEKEEKAGADEAGDADGMDLSGDPDFEDPSDFFEIEKEMLDDARQAGLYLPHPACLEEDNWTRLSCGDHPQDPYDVVRAEVAGQIGALRRRQLARIQTSSRKRLRIGLDEGDLDETRLSETALGARDLYTETQKGRQINVAIQLLVDLSGSTHGNTEKFIRRTVVALSESWAPIRGLSFSIIGYYNDYQKTGLEYGLQPDGVHYVRNTFRFLVFKDWNERPNVLRERFREMGPHGDNADHEAVVKAAERLVGRSEERKILGVVSDGYPACMGVPENEEMEGLRLAVKRISRSGIEVWGIGAGTDAPSKFYNEETGARNVVINDVSTMAERLVKLFDRRIR